LALKTILTTDDADTNDDVIKGESRYTGVATLF